MASTIEEIEEAIKEAISTGHRGRLLDRGLSRSMIWVDGVLPDGAPQFADSLSYDLLSYGYSLLSLALRLRELNGDEGLCRSAFERSATAITDVIHNGRADDPEADYHKVLSAAAFHLGRFSAKAFSLIHERVESGNISVMERALAYLIIRRLDSLESLILNWKTEGNASDQALALKLENDINQFSEAIGTESQPEEFGFSSVEAPIIDLAITDNYLSSLFEYLCALETGNKELHDSAISRIQMSLEICADLNLLPQWWVLRISKHLLGDLWVSNFHSVLPVGPNQDFNAEWLNLRWMFILSLFKREKAEIELWPSQIDGARRAINDSDDLVVSLPTSAGKTRVAELCILRCLAIGKRVLFITPLRALSAQTEVSLRKTFLPLGKTVSSLYGSIGTSDFEQDVLKTQDIVVGTPEKLDFALRNDSTLIDDVGLIILDEGHMIGINEREINYEVQIQRLLKRPDADLRRIVCLSAILPDGDQFEDFVNWIRRDKEGGAIQSDWRPTDLRFGEIVWQNNTGRINFTIGDEKPFIPGYIQPSVPSLPNPGLRATPFPKNAQELTLAATWRLVGDGHTVLIYCPQRASVDAFGTAIIDLHKRGALGSVLTVPEHQIELAKVLGCEWLGDNHPIVKCLEIGVAIHHGALPTPFRKEMERLLREGILKVTVSSPTLAQGLNLAATAVIVHSLYRSGKLIEVSEFKNVIGRAGRAFVDTHGLVLHPVFDRHDWRKRQWHALIQSSNARNMESGLFRLVLSLLLRMAEKLKTQSTEPLLEYVLNNTLDWSFPIAEGETLEQAEENRNQWNRHLNSLDTALLSLLGEEDVPIEEIPSAIDSILHSSLWQRRLNRCDDDLKTLFNSVVAQRGKHIWNVSTSLQRKGYFLAGVGLLTGQALDDIADQANGLLIQANAYILKEEQSHAIAAITKLAELLFAIPPFTPITLPDNWKVILEIWLKGESLRAQSFENIDEVLKFIEDGLIYRLPWGMEAIRVRALANEDDVEESLQINDYMIVEGGTIDEKYELGLAVPAVENGTLSRSAAMLMQAGFNSRLAAIHAVSSTGASFASSRGFKAWLNSEEVFHHTLSMTWPTPETAMLWWKFVEEYKPRSETTWRSASCRLHVSWINDEYLETGALVKLWNTESGKTRVLGTDGEYIGNLFTRYNLLKGGVYSSVVSDNTNYLDVIYYGAGEHPFEYAD